MGNPTTVVIYHPFLGFLVDTDGTWSTDRDQAKANKDAAEAVDVVKAAVDNGLDLGIAKDCLFLPWW